MKKLRHYLLLALLLALLAALPASAYDFKINELCYYLNDDGESVTVTFEVYGKDNLRDAHYNSLSGDLTIPSSVNLNGETYTVTAIGDYAFTRCCDITSLTIPNTVTSIGDYAFYECYKFASVTIPNSVLSIGKSAFQYHGLKTLTIPNSVKTIGDYAFYAGGERLTLLIIGEQLSSIGRYAFSRNSDLETIRVKSGNKVYDSRDNCNAIIETATNTLVAASNNTIIPNTVTAIGEGAFYELYTDYNTYNTNPKHLTIPNSVTSIGDKAFYACSFLESIDLPNSISYVGEDAFRSTAWLKNQPYEMIYIGDAAYLYKWDGSADDITIALRNGTKSISPSCFASIPKIVSVSIPNTVTTIGNKAFMGCKLSNITIPNSVTSIGINALMNCENLTQIIVNSNNKVYDSRDNCNAIIKTATNTLVTGCGNSVIPNSVTAIGEQAFFNCSKLNYIIIPNSVTSVGEYAFSQCGEVRKISIPNSVKSIGAHAFRETNIMKLYCYNPHPSNINMGEDVFEDDWENNKVYSYLIVPIGTIDLYQQANQWKGFYNIYALGDLNGDNSTNTGDVSTLYSVILNGPISHLVDVNDDFNVNTGDISSLYSIILGN